MHDCNNNRYLFFLQILMNVMQTTVLRSAPTLLAPSPVPATVDSHWQLMDDPATGICGGRLTSASGSFQSPGWPDRYPHKDFKCEWIIELSSSASRIAFTVDDSAFGINGRVPCTNDHIQFFDGTASNANSLLKL